MKRIAVLTSGGDSPGMNAAIRAVVRAAVAQGMSVSGVRRGFAGLAAGEFRPLGARDVGGIIQTGGTILGSARSPEFEDSQTQRMAIRVLESHRIEGLVVIGGDGSQTGAHALATLGFPVVGIASTIDNDLVGSDVSIGVDTALNVALEAIDRLRVTASSLHRIFLVEVMGRHCGYLALMAGIAGGAEAIVVPEVDVSAQSVAEELCHAYARGKAHAIAVVAEGARDDADALARYFSQHDGLLKFEVRVTRLGHVQRGGAPGAFDRLLATRLGLAAVESLSNGRFGILRGLLKGEIAETPLAAIAGRSRVPDLRLLETARILAQ